MRIRWDWKIECCNTRAGKNEKAVDELLIDLQREKQEVEEKLAGLSEKEKQLEKLIKNYDQLSRDLEFRRKKFKLEVKEAALQKSARENQVLEGLIRELREAQNIEKAKELATQIREERNRLHQEVGQLQEKVAEVQPVPSGKLKSGAFGPGDFVRLRSGGSVGQIESIDKKKAIVLMGQMRLSIKLADLEHAHEPMDPGKTRGVMADTVEASAQFESKIDIRGMRMDEALIIVQNFVDQALMNGSDKLRILHGKGDGILRKAVKNKLREYGPAVSVSHPPAASGGDGVTLVELS